MHRSAVRKGPVVTILTQSQQSSKHIQKFLQSFFQTKVVPLSSSISPTTAQKEKTDTDALNLNDIFHPMLKYKFNSHASICEASNTILHFLSIDSCDDIHDKVSNDAAANDTMTILAVTPGPSSVTCNVENDSSNGAETITVVSEEECAEHITNTRNAILKQIQTKCQNQDQQQQGQGQGQLNVLGPLGNDYYTGTRLAFIKYWKYRNISPRDILTLHSNDLPLLDLSLSSMPPPSESLIKSSMSSALELSTAQVDNDGVNGVDNNIETNKFRLREIVIPFFDSATYAHGKSMLQIFSNSSLHRPKTGLYQWKLNENNTRTKTNQSSIVFRPLPSPSIDMKLPPVTFVYQCNTLEDAKDQLVNLQNDEAHGNKTMTIQLSKVGFNGYQNNGQLRVERSYFYNANNNTTNNGKSKSSGNENSCILPSSLEFRYCDAKELSSTFAEAHESLLAGSLDDLQNVNVMVEGSTSPSSSTSPSFSSSSSITMNGESSNNNKTEARVDTMNGLGDCWVEFRANMKQPSGFFKKNPNATNSEVTTGNSIRQWLSVFVQGGLMGISRNNGTKNTRNNSRVAKAPDIPYE